MAIPNPGIDSAAPAGTDSPGDGDDQIRALKLFLQDVFGFPDATTITAAAMAITAAGIVTVPLKAVFTLGFNTIQSVDNVHDTTPTDAEIDTAFGTPATQGRGFIGTIDDASGETNFYIVVSSDNSWFWTKLTKAA